MEMLTKTMGSKNLELLPGCEPKNHCIQGRNASQLFFAKKILLKKGTIVEIFI